MLSDDQVVQLLSRDGTREDMLQAAYRAGMLRAAEVCEELSTRAYDADECAEVIRNVAIRAEAS